MDSLPPELIQDILGYLSVSDLRSVRLSSRGLSEQSGPQFFKNITTTSFPQSLHNVRALSDHPTYSGYVQSITNDNRILAPPGNRTEWQKSSETPNHPSYVSGGGRYVAMLNIYELWRQKLIRDRKKLLDKKQWERDMKQRRARSKKTIEVPPVYSLMLDEANQLPTLLDERYDMYCQYLENQGKLSCKNRTVATLTEMVAKFPKLKSMTMGIVPATSALPLSLELVRYNIFVRPNHVDRHANAGALLALLEGTKRSGVTLMEFRTAISSALFDQNFSKLSVVRSIFPKLNRLTLNLTIMLSFSKERRDRRMKEFSALVAAANNLQSLELSIDYPQHDYPPTISALCDPKAKATLAEVLQTRSHWPKLSSFKFRGFDTDSVTILHFLERHAGTVRSFELADIMSSWNGIAKEGVWACWIEVLKGLKHSGSYTYSVG